MKQSEVNMLYDPKNIPIQPTEEAIRFDFYSYLPVPSSATPAEYNFFGYSLGGTVTGTSTRATRLWTNMTKANEIPAPYRFLLKEFALDVSPAVSTLKNGSFIDDKYNILENGYFGLEVGSKSYQEGRVKYLPEMSRYQGATALATTATSTTMQRDVWALVGRTYEVSPAMLLPYGINFRFTVKYDTAPTVSDTVMFGVIMRGILVRPAQ
jgi:hypothetical protein